MILGCGYLCFHSVLSWEQAVDVAQIVTAIGTLLVAVWALCFTHRQNQFAREHNVRMVVPLLDVHRDINNIVLENHGYGPAILRSLVVKFGSEHFELVTSNDWVGLHKYVRTNFDLRCSITNFASQAAISPNSGSQTVMTFHVEDGEVGVDAIARINLEIELIGSYEDLFGNLFSVEMPKLRDDLTSHMSQSSD